MKGRVLSINVSKGRGTRKTPVDKALIGAGQGIEGDAHSGSRHRQVSLLSVESIRKMNAAPGDFAENITTEGIDLLGLSVGSRLLLGGSVEAEVSQIGKSCHKKCRIFEELGDCVMPKEGIFVRILRGGSLAPGDGIEAVASDGDGA